MYPLVRCAPRKVGNKDYFEEFVRAKREELQRG